MCYICVFCGPKLYIVAVLSPLLKTCFAGPCYRPCHAPLNRVLRPSNKSVGPKGFMQTFSLVDFVAKGPPRPVANTMCWAGAIPGAQQYAKQWPVGLVL